MALIAPWLLGGRAPAAHLILGTLAWLSALASVGVVLADYREWRHFGAFDQRRGLGRKSPLRLFGRGLLRSLPIWVFLVVLFLSALNPAFRWEGSGADRALVVEAFHPFLPIVVDPVRSRPGIFFLSGLLAALALVSNPVARPPRDWMRQFLAILLLNAVLLAWVGLVFKFAGNGKILGTFDPVADYFFATFYYKNHWAAYALLYCGVGAFFFFRDLPRWFTHGRQAGSGGLALIGILFLGLSFPIVDSRSGVLLFSVFLGIFFIALFRKLRSARARSILALCAVLGLGMFVILSAADLRSDFRRTEQQIEKAESILFDSIRAFHGPEVCFALISERPYLGWGYLSYDPIFPVYATDFFRDDAGVLRSDMEFAHNDWLQHTAEFGIPAMLLLLFGLFLLPGPQPRPQASSSPPETGQDGRAGGPSGFAWIGVSLLLLGFLATWEFPFSNPAVLANAACLFAIGGALRGSGARR